VNEGEVLNAIFLSSKIEGSGKDRRQSITITRSRGRLSPPRSNRTVMEKENEHDRRGGGEGKFRYKNGWGRDQELVKGQKGDAASVRRASDEQGAHLQTDFA